MLHLLTPLLRRLILLSISIGCDCFVGDILAVDTIRSNVRSMFHARYVRCYGSIFDDIQSTSWLVRAKRKVRTPTSNKALAVVASRVVHSDHTIRRRPSISLQRVVRVGSASDDFTISGPLTPHTPHQLRPRMHTIAHCDASASRVVWCGRAVAVRAGFRVRSLSRQLTACSPLASLNCACAARSLLLLSCVFRLDV